MALDAAGNNEKWAVACKTVADVDSEYLTHFDRYDFRLATGKTADAWGDALASLSRKLVLVRSEDTTPRPLADAERICGPVMAWNKGPAIAWTERNNGTWRLILWQDGKPVALTNTPSLLRQPAVAVHGNDILVACEFDRNGKPTIGIWNSRNEQIAELSGRQPVMTSGSEGCIWLAFERGSSDSVTLHLQSFREGALDRIIDLPKADEFNMNPSLAYDSGARTLYIAWESCAAWGMDEVVGRHRDISLWTLADGAAEPVPAPGTSNGFLALKREAIIDSNSAFNATPIHPRVLLRKRRPIIAFQLFRPRGDKEFGWDVWLTEWNGTNWKPQRRMSPNLVLPDGGYALLPQDNGWLAAFPCCDQTPVLSFEEIRNGANGRQTQAAHNFRIEIVHIADDSELPPLDTRPGRRPAYEIPASSASIAAPSPSLPNAPAEFDLVWMNPHMHSAYSKCMSANNGTPDDVFRLQRDVFGCRILCISEHVEYIRAPEFVHVLDRLEAACGDICLPLYGVEWAMDPAHHTNFYAADRGVFDRLRAILLSETHLTPIFRRIKDTLPTGSVAVIRHFHGVNKTPEGINGAEFFKSYDPELEVAMEAMQTRGNMMIPGPGVRPNLFPSDFLNAGARIGLVGGSDHSRGRGSNSFCLTGLWLPEFTPQAVLNTIRERRTFAAANGKLGLWAKLDGAPMGSEIKTQGPVCIRINAGGPRPLLRACLIRDGKILPWTPLNGTTAEFDLADDNPPPGSHWYVVTVEADSCDAKAPIFVQASPFFVTI